MKFLKINMQNNDDSSFSKDKWKFISDLKEKSFNRTLLLFQVIIACSYAFGVGYSLYYIDNTIITAFNFLILFVFIYIIIVIPHEFLHILCYKSKKNVVVKYNLLKLYFISHYNGILSKKRVFILLLLPFITFTIIPTIISYILEFNIFLYALASANAIISSRDLLNVILMLKNAPKGSKLKIYENNLYYFTNTKTSNEFNDNIEVDIL